MVQAVAPGELLRSSLEHQLRRCFAGCNTRRNGSVGLFVALHYGYSSVSSSLNSCCERSRITRMCIFINLHSTSWQTDRRSVTVKPSVGL